MHRLLKNIFLLSLRQSHFSNLTIKLLSPTPPVLYFKKGGIYTQIQQKQPSQRPAVASFRYMNAWASTKFVPT